MSAIIQNTGTNYTLYYNIMYWFRVIMSNHPSIGVVTTGDWWDIGEREFPEYPIGNIQILDVDFGTNVTNYTCTLTIADKIKNKNNESNPTNNTQTIPFYQTDDKIDIWANTLAILNDLSDYTQRSVTNFDIDGDIICTPFVDRFDNGLAGWTAEFILTTHNDKNRCLFDLIPTIYVVYVIENCSTGQRYKATLLTDSYSVAVGDVFSTLKSPGLSNTYGNLVCYKIIEKINDTSRDLIDLPVLQPGPIDTCAICNLWINPKVWSTTPAAWSGTDAEFRTWSTV